VAEILKPLGFREPIGRRSLWAIMTKFLIFSSILIEETPRKRRTLRIAPEKKESKGCYVFSSVRSITTLPGMSSVL